MQTTEPRKITAGDTISWKKSLSEYPATSGWVLSYVLINATNKVSITASASGDDHLVSVSASTSAAWKKGDYTYQAYVTKSSERFMIGSGEIQILPNLAVENALDGRSQVKKTLDAINAVIEKRASIDQEQYSISGRSLSRTPIADLIVLRDKYQALYNSEVNADRVSKGLSPKNRIMVRM